LFLSKKKLPGSEGTVVKWPTRKIFTNMEIDEPYLSASNYGVSVTQVRLALAKGFNFGAKQHHAGFQLLKKLVIVRGGPVLGHD
jgi:hypothetical protein